MKVCTDACLFGGWVASLVQNKKIESALDIGAGTGLLSLMIAQSVPAQIDAVELDEDAWRQASENFRRSPWSERLTAIHKDIREYENSHRYDLVFSNPPFYENDLVSEDEKRNLALHSTSFGLQELLKNATRLMQADGLFAALLPFRRVNYFEKELGASGFFIHQKVKVRQTPAHDYFRCMYLLKRNRASFEETEIIIKSSHQYTEPFYALLKDYYL